MGAEVSNSLSESVLKMGEVEVKSEVGEMSEWVMKLVGSKRLEVFGDFYCPLIQNVSDSNAVGVEWEEQVVVENVESGDGGDAEESTTELEVKVFEEACQVDSSANLIAVSDTDPRNEVGPEPEVPVPPIDSFTELITDSGAETTNEMDPEPKVSVRLIGRESMPPATMAEMGTNTSQHFFCNAQVGTSQEITMESGTGMSQPLTMDSGIQTSQGLLDDLISSLATVEMEKSKKLTESIAPAAELKNDFKLPQSQMRRGSNLSIYSNPIDYDESNKENMWSNEKSFEIRCEDSPFQHSRGTKRRREDDFDDEDENNYPVNFSSLPAGSSLRVGLSKKPRRKPLHPRVLSNRN